LFYSSNRVQEQERFMNAKKISNYLLFLEYELQSLLLNKLKIKDILVLKLQVSAEERFIIDSGFCSLSNDALTPPIIPQIASGNLWHNEEQLVEV